MAARRSMINGTMFAAIVAIVAATSLWTGAMAQSSCTNVLISMSPCLDYIQGNSSKPSSSCCSQLASVVKSSPECLCEVLNDGASSLGITVNQTQARAMPTACNVKTPPASQCNASSPSDSPSGTSNSTSGGGSKTVPTTDDGTSTGNSIKLSFSLLSFLLLAASSFFAI
ncbi:Plant lipid transfer protein/Par allergen [Corchorus capsularis]|uniref:Plant lipid transfer protein/Par allergen n=1 Tax=Corchorus capsularis TaxID=210143 RepID=A0A1R3I512_COCAP|nr:Plant lipid transfer protein/Par allergen [Corchorus capsularis]